MNDADFLHTIVEEPENEEVRLVYADWLLERNDPRGEFIQVQCQLARWEEGSGDWKAVAPHLYELRLREKALLREYGAKWSEPVRGLVKGYTFRRGFIEKVRMEESLFGECGEELFRSAPVTQIWVCNTLRRSIALPAVPWLERLRGLDLRGNPWQAARLRSLMESPYLRNVHALGLSRCSVVGNEALEMLAMQPRLAQLRFLDLRETWITERGLRDLLHSPYLRADCQVDVTTNWYLRRNERARQGALLTSTDDPVKMQKVWLAWAGPPTRLQVRAARRLAFAAFAPEGARVSLLLEALEGSNVDTRAAAAEMLGRLGVEGLPGIAGLLRRLREGSRRVRSMAAWALAKLLPHLSAPLRRWLGLLGDPVLLAESKLLAALERRELPDGVWLTLARYVHDRLLWHRAFRRDPPLPPGESRPVELLAQRSEIRLREQVQRLLNTAQERAAAAVAGMDVPAGETARDREATRLVARLWELLVQEEGPPGLPLT